LDLAVRGDGRVCSLARTGELNCWTDLFDWDDPTWDGRLPSGSWARLGRGDGDLTLIDPRGDVFRWDGTKLDRVLTANVSGSFVDSVSRDDTGCGLTETGTLRCWSWWAGLEPAARFKQIDQGCGVTVDGDIECWHITTAPAVLEVP